MVWRAEHTCSHLAIGLTKEFPLQHELKCPRVDGLCPALPVRGDSLTVPAPCAKSEEVSPTPLRHLPSARTMAGKHICTMGYG